MSRVWAGATRSQGWVMSCDRLGCLTRSEVQRSEHLLPLERFVAEGWYIARVHGDRCPECVAAHGGIDAVLADRRALAPVRLGAEHPAWPHRLMEAS